MTLNTLATGIHEIVTSHIFIVTLIIIVVGAFSGWTKYENKDIEDKKYLKKYILNGIGSACLVPLFLNMLSSDLIKDGDDSINYFVFAGFCFLAGYFADRFILAMGEKILKDIEEVKSEVVEVKRQSDEMSREFGDLIESETRDIADIRNLYEDNNAAITFMQQSPDEQTNLRRKIYNTFQGKFKYRTLKGIVEEVKENEFVVNTVINVLKGDGQIKEVKIPTKNTTVLYLTRKGFLVSEIIGDL
jgi:hypothetical protein